MHEFFQQLDQLRHLDRRVSLATLVHTRGTSPRKEGAKMWVEEGGALFGSVTIGGCADAYVIDQSETVLTNHRPCLIELPLGDEDAWELGLSCAGTIEIFIEPMTPNQSQSFDFYTSLQSHIASGASGALLTCLDEATIGARLLLFDDGNALGSLGDPQLDQEACRVGLSHIHQGFSRTVSIHLSDQTVRVFIEVYTPPATLIIVGASHVATVLVQLARTVGFQTVVVDSRPRFATPERFPNADKLLVGIPSEIVKTLPLSSVTAVILVAHDYKYDLPILRQVLSSPAGYIGVLGSRRRGEGLLKFLQEEGLTEEALQRIRVPIGLDLGGQTAPEIALAILAEVVSTRHSGGHLPLSQQRKRSE